MKQQLVFLAAMLGFTYAVFSPHESATSSNGPGSDFVLSSSRPGASKIDSHGDATVLNRDGSGQFHLTAEVEGQPVEFLVDTGADIVALTVDEAESLGLDVDPDNFAPMGQTASGVGSGQMVSLDRMEIAGTEFHDVDAVVMEGLSTNLLGQSILRQLGGVTLEGDQMVIHH